MTLRRTLVIMAISLTIIRLVCVVFVPFSATSPSLLLVVARPAGETILLSTANAPWDRTLLVAVLAFASRLALDVAVFTASRYSTEHLPRRWQAIIPRVKGVIPPRLLLALVTIYSATVLVVALAITEVKMWTAVLCLALNSLFVVSAYIILSKRFPTAIQIGIGFIDENRTLLTLALTLGVVVVLLGFLRHRNDK
jgi:hypothetical protein